MVVFGQLNRAFVVGLAGATIASLGLFALSGAGGEVRDVGRAKLNATADCAPGRQPNARTLRTDIDAIALNLPRIQFDNLKRQGDRE